MIPRRDRQAARSRTRYESAIAPGVTGSADPLAGAATGPEDWGLFRTGSQMPETLGLNEFEPASFRTVTRYETEEGA